MIKRHFFLPVNAMCSCFMPICVIVKQNSKAAIMLAREDYLFIFNLNVLKKNNSICHCFNLFSICSIFSVTDLSKFGCLVVLGLTAL